MAGAGQTKTTEAKPAQTDPEREAIRSIVEDALRDHEMRKRLEPARVDFDKIMSLVPGIAMGIERLMLSKGVSYLDPKVEEQQKRTDRAELIEALLVAFSDQAAGMTPRPEGVADQAYVSEHDLIVTYREGMQAQGLFLLPHVEDSVIDGSGGVILTVSFTLASKTGAIWPDIVKVVGHGNDRVAQQRGGMGDKAGTRAMSAAWKEAVARLALLARGNDPEAYEAAHLPLPSSRPSNSRPERGPGMTMQQEEEFKARIIKGLGKAQSVRQIERYMAIEEIRAKLPGCSGKTRKAIEDEVAECKRRCDPRSGGHRQDRRQIEQGPYDHAEDADEARSRRREQHFRGEQQDYGDPSGQHRGADLDDDIPF